MLYIYVCVSVDFVIEQKGVHVIYMCVCFSGLCDRAEGCTCYIYMCVFQWTL